MKQLVFLFVIGLFFTACQKESLLAPTQQINSNPEVYFNKTVEDHQGAAATEGLAPTYVYVHIGEFDEGFTYSAALAFLNWSPTVHLYGNQSSPTCFTLNFHEFVEKPNSKYTLVYRAQIFQAYNNSTANLLLTGSSCSCSSYGNIDHAGPAYLPVFQDGFDKHVYAPSVFKVTEAYCE